MPNSHGSTPAGGRGPPRPANHELFPPPNRGLLRWEPLPLPPPSLDPEFATWPAWRRMLATLGYCLRRVEYGLSPNGALRAWLALCLTLFIAVAVPLALALPLVTVVLTALDSWARLLRAIMVNLLVALLAFLAIVVVSLVLAVLFRARRPAMR